MKARDTWAAATLPAVVVEGAIGAERATEVRARLEAAGYERYALLDRGSYDVAAVAEPELLDTLAGIASAITERDLAVTEARAIRLRPGDYVLLRHDRVASAGSTEQPPVELVLDVSLARVPDAEVHYRHRGQVFFAFGSQPGALALVARGPTVLCNHTYVSKAHRDLEVVRVVALLRDASVSVLS